jgi:hypothetical protein
VQHNNQTPPEIYINHALNPLNINLKIAQILKPLTPLSTSEARQRCSKSIGTIARKASNTLSDKLREKENKSYDKSPKHYHNNLKISTGLLLRARDQPMVTTLKNPLTKTIHTSPQEVIDIVTSHFQKEQQRATPECLSTAP